MLWKPICPSIATPTAWKSIKAGAVWIICQNRQSLVRVDPDTKAMVEYLEPVGGGGQSRELFVDPKGMMWYAEWLGGKITSVKELTPGDSAKTSHMSGAQ